MLVRPKPTEGRQIVATDTSSGTAAKAGAFDLTDPKQDEGWVNGLPAADRISYYEARQAYEKAAKERQEALAASAKARDKLTVGVAAAADEAGKALEAAGKKANDKLAALKKVDELSLPSLREAADDSVTTRRDEVKKCVDEYNAALDEVAAKKTEFEKKVGELREIAKDATEEDLRKKPTEVDFREDVKAVAEAQREIADAATDKKFDKAADAFLQARAKLYAANNEVTKAPAPRVSAT